MLHRIICLFFINFISVYPLWYEKGQIVKENRLLKAELALARKQTTYFLLNIEDKKIYLKARGIVLREWEIVKIRHWGDAVSQRPISLIKKSALFIPKREKIKPNKKRKEGEFKLEALEVNYMPKSYTIFLEGSVVIYIQPKSKGLISLFNHITHSFKWYIVTPFLTAWFSIKNSSFTAIDVVLINNKEAQTLYWSFQDSAELIIF